MSSFLQKVEDVEASLFGLGAKRSLGEKVKIGVKKFVPVNHPGVTSLPPPLKRRFLQLWRAQKGFLVPKGLKDGLVDIGDGILLPPEAFLVKHEAPLLEGL